MFNDQFSIFSFLINAMRPPLIVAIHRQKNIGYRIIFTHFPNISLLRTLIDNFKNINFNIH
jgi:hypothetical protein